MCRFHERLERGEINRAGAGRAVVARGKLHVVDVKPGKARGERFEVQRVMNEAEVFLDLRVAAIVPIKNVRTVEFAEEKLEVAFERDFFKRLTVFAAEFESALFSFGQ